MKRFWRIMAVLGLIAGLTPLLPANIAVADDAVVGSGSAVSCTEAAFDTALALAHQNGGGEITFNCGGPATITFTGLKTIITLNTITINGGNEITLDGTSTAAGMFFVQNVATLNLVGLAVENSTKIGSGAVVFSAGGNVTITDSTISDNSATGGASHGGVLFSAGGSVTITYSTISDNTATGGGSGGGALFNAGGNVTIEASTFNGNTAQESGGAIFNSGGTLTVTQSTFYDNTSTLAVGGAIAQNAGTTSITGSTLNGNNAGGNGGAISILGGSATVARSIVAGNSAAGSFANCFGGAPTSLDYNLSNDATCPFTQPNDIQNSANLNLGPLADNGGPTMTMLPAEDSDAIDTAGDCAEPLDQRGEERPSGDACDIGSVEVQVIPSATFTLCANWYTGRLSSPFNGVCNPNNQFELVTPDAYPLTFCLSLWTGAVSYSFGRPCPAGTLTHVVPDDGDLLTCVSVYDGGHRFVWSHSQCTAVELPNTIYGS